MSTFVDIALCWLPHGAGLTPPQFQTAGSSGADLAAAVDVDDPIVLAPGARCAVPCGFGLSLPQGYEAQIRPRSGLAIKQGITVLNAPGTIDADYRGQIQVILINHGTEPFTICRGDRIAQMVVVAVTNPHIKVVTNLDDTQRGAKGFGSTGV